MLRYNRSMSMKEFITIEYFVKSKLKAVLFLSFFILIALQSVIGFKQFEDYLLILIFILFANDQYAKFKHSNDPFYNDSDDKKVRLIFSMFLLMFFIISLIFESVRLNQESEVLLFKIFFILWGQVFLLDTVQCYKNSHKKTWLVFSSTAMFLIIFTAIMV